MRRINAIAAGTVAMMVIVVAADSNDWVNVNYVLKQGSSSGSSDTASSRKSIVSSAGSSAKSGPWTVVDKGSVAPPSGDPQDYLSWAPYHWPDCNWCSTGTTHLSNPGSGDGGDDGDDSSDDSDDNPDDADPDSDPSTDPDPYDDGDDDSLALLIIREHSDIPSKRSRGIFGSHRRMRKVKRASSVDLQHIRRDDGLPAGDPSALPTSDTTLQPTAEVSALLNATSALPTPTDNVSQLSLATGSTSSSIGTVAGTPAPAQAPAKTSQGGKSSCTPSPTKSLAPSATWTTCPYKVHDGKVNPDVRTLPDSPAVVSMSQSVLYNSLAYAMQKTSAYSQSAASFIDAFFLSSKTGMHPNMNFGQMVRGPGKDHQVGTFTGILDLRGLVKVVNGIQLLKAAGSPDWTSARDKEMTSWMNQYITWLQTSDIGKQTASTPNNHFTFYTSQLAAAKLYVGDTSGATTALQNYFSNQYLDQVAASGEQPFEAVRTRPYHYRCFNLEAMITNAKIGDQLGLNLWSAKSKYGATIQTALDYTMGLSPGSEAVSDIFPHVAAVAAAYGDPKGKYAAFLQKQISTYKSTPFYFYDQTAALPNSPAAHSTHKRGVDEQLGKTLSTVSGMEGFVTDAAIAAAQIPFECPAVFALSPVVEIDDDIYVTCDQLEPFYEISVPFGTNTSALVA